VFALCHFLGFEFAPRIADLADKNLYMPGKAGDWPALSSLIGGSSNRKRLCRNKKFRDRLPSMNAVALRRANS
jgi:TnpA family transposase